MSGRVFYKGVRVAFRLVAAPLFRLEIAGAARLPGDGPAIVVAEHRSWLDPPVVGAACPRPVAFLILDSVYRKPWANWFYRGMRSIPVRGREGGARSLREALRRLDAGEVVGVFPEGRVVADGEQGRYRDGAARLALRSGAPVVPLGIGGTARAWPKGRRWPGPAPVSVRFGDPIAPPGRGKGDVATFASRLESELRALSEEARDHAAGR